VDLSKLEKVEDLTKRLVGHKIYLDGIVNNAGILPTYQQITSYQGQQIEETAATHLLAPFKLSTELLPILNS
jgi:NAD(P)-dependent dehydrogenase (short-subunit alcohol dehydrogenase family)